MKYAVSCAVVLSVAGMAQVGMADTINPALTGNTQYDGWNALTAVSNPGFPGFPGFNPWPSAIGSNLGGDANLNKVSNGSGGGPFPSGGGLYFGGVSFTPNTLGGTLSVTDTTPVANLANVVFQIEIGEAFGFDFFNDALPTLSYNGGSQNLVANYNVIVESVQNGTFTPPSGIPEPLYINTYLLQWDVSAIAGITDIKVTFSGVQHATVGELRLDQSDTYVQLSIPTPASAALLGMGGLIAARRRRA